MPASLFDRFARHAQRWGMVGGALGVPLVWIAGEGAVGLLRGSWLRADEVENYAFWGAASGALLGGVCARAWVQWRSDHQADARATLFLMGAAGTAFWLSLVALNALAKPNFAGEFVGGAMNLVFSLHLPFLLSALMLFVGALMPRR